MVEDAESGWTTETDLAYEEEVMVHTDTAVSTSVGEKINESAEATVS